MKIIYKDVFDGINEIENKSIRCCITSPPYYQCRNYNNNPKQIGLEDTSQQYIQKLCNVFSIVKDKITDDGNLFINLGDKYDKDKNLMLIPTDFAQLMKQDGWILRNDIIWYKPNFQPSPVTDRLTNTYEHIFHFVKSKKYYYDLDSIRIPNQCKDDNPHNTYERFQNKIYKSDLTDLEKKNAIEDLTLLFDKGYINRDARLKIRNHNKVLYGGDVKLSGRAKELQDKGYYFHCNNPKGKNMGDLLSINIKSYKGIHEAVFPEELVEPLIKVGSNVNDYVLDCFAGTCTTLKTAEKLNRKGIGIELNEIYNANYNIK